MFCFSLHFLGPDSLHQRIKRSIVASIGGRRPKRIGKIDIGHEYRLTLADAAFENAHGNRHTLFALHFPAPRAVEHDIAAFQVFGDRRKSSCWKQRHAPMLE